jgi:hypothetical protein
MPDPDARCSLHGCAVWFIASPGQVYCSDAHVLAAAKDLERVRLKKPAAADAMEAGECLRPDKQAFPDFIAAQARADELGGDRRGIGPYRCSCGRIHIGNAPGAKQGRWDYLEGLAWMREFADADDPGWSNYPEGRYGPIEQSKLP